MALTRLCSIKECGNTIVASGLCNSHYKRMRKHGDPTVKKRAANGEAMTHFTEVILKFEGDECLIWPFHRGRDGYGQLYSDGQNRCVSRLVCERVRGKPPTPEHESAHSCGKGHEGCVTKAHLSWKTHAENEADKSGHGTRLTGSDHPNAKIKDADISAMRHMAKDTTQTEIARMFGVSRSHVGNILRGVRRSASV